MDMSAELVNFLEAVQTQPRNVWSRLLASTELAKTGAFYQAAQFLEGVKYHPDLQEDLLSLYRAHIAAIQVQAQAGKKVNIPADYLTMDQTVLHKPFRQVQSDSIFPMPYPYGLTLPSFVGLRNDYGFLREVASLDAGQTDLRVHVVWSPLDCQDAVPFLAALAEQGYGGTVSLTVMCDSHWPAGLEGYEVLECSLLSPQGAQRIARLPQEADLVLFLSGDVQLDDAVLQRATFLARVSDQVVQPLVAMTDAVTLETPFTQAGVNKIFTSRYPFRDANGLNFAISAALLKKIGGPDPRFLSSFWAGREMMFRAFNTGCYFAPLAVPDLLRCKEDTTPAEDEALYVQLCPEHWARKRDGRFEVPKVSVYIPVYNASKYIERAIDSVLGQDVEDLELCLHNDGSRDHTLQVLEDRYGEEPRVRWQSDTNGGIGYASNQAIQMSRAMYIGQLDSDDCLKPGAIRHLMEHMDAHPDLACCYASCERIDKDGTYLQDEYSWPQFRREKMMITSIAHHFRMFRRAAWERTSKFREDIVNAVDYDIFLKMSEVGPFHHIDEKYYQRRWHGENTSSVNEGHQTTNTYRVQQEALTRLGLDRFWDVHIADPEQPRRVGYRRRGQSPMVFFWPHYRSNPYQRLLYAKAGREVEFCVGPIEAALRIVREGKQPGQMTFHLHWLNFLFVDADSQADAKARVAEFLKHVKQFKAHGGRLIWTIHNTLSHDMPYVDLERQLSQQLAKLADVLHFHSGASVAEVEQAFDIPRDKVRIVPHGAYIGAYPDFVSRDQARRALGLDRQDDVILFTGQIRPYKGVESLVQSFRKILVERPNALLLIAGAASFDLMGAIDPALLAAEQARIHFVDRFLEDGELQLFFRAADIAVYPYQKILTSGSMLLALSYGLPVVIPEVGMTADVLREQEAGLLYDGDGAEAALEHALRLMLARKDDGALTQMKVNARKLAEALQWQDFSQVIRGKKGAATDD